MSALSEFSDEELLDRVSEHTTMMKGPLWLRQIRENERRYGFSQTLNGIRHEGRKAVVLAAGPGFKRFGTEDLMRIVESKPRPLIVACDGALPTLSALGIKWDYSVSVDAHPVVANFYRRVRANWDGAPPVALLSTTIHRDVVEQCKIMGMPIRWFQGFFKNNNSERYGNTEKFYREGISSINSAGNVGSTSFVITSMVFGARPIGLMGLEFSWSDETPYNELQYFGELMKATGNDVAKTMKFFKKVRNHRDGRIYIADPTYYSYRTMFRELWKILPVQVRKNTFNLTKQGILSARGLKTLTAEEFIRL